MKAVVGARLRPLSFSVLLALCAAPYVLSGEPALAAQTVQRYEVPAGPLESTLTQIARQGGSVVSFTTELVSGKTSHAVNGEFSVQDALRQALIGTGLELVVRAEGVMTLRQSGPGVQTLGAVAVTADRLDVTEGTGSYATQQTTRGKGMSWRETPQSVSVMTQQRIDDQGLQNIGEVMDQTTGVTVGMGFFGTTERAYYSRGFLISNMQIDGSAAAASLNGYDYSPNLLGFDHVEVVRGPDGLFAGNGEPGGSISLSRKRATDTLQVKGELSAGRWDHYRGVIDVGGPLAWQGKVRGRAVLSQLDERSFIDRVDNRTSYFYGTLEADLTDSTLLIVGASYEKSKHRGFIMGLPRYSDGGDLGLPRSTSLGTDWSRGESTNTEIFARLEQQLGEKWKLSASATRTQRDTDYWLGVTWGAVDRATLTGPYRYLDRYNYERKLMFYDLALSGSFELLGRQHKLVVGVDGQRVDPRNTTRYYQFGLGDIDIFNYDAYVNVPPEPDWNAWANGGGGNGDTTYSTDKQKGLYAKFQFALTDSLHLIAGGRWASYENTNDSKRYKETGIFTPYGGLVYDINDEWTTYFSITDIYKSQANRLKGPQPGTPLDPIQGRNFEVGLKGELLDGRLNTALSLYHTRRNRQAVQDPSYPSSTLPEGSQCCFVEGGRIVSRGVDLEVAGEVWPGVQLMAGYTFNINEDKTKGIPYHSVTPKHLFKLWANWKPQSSPWSFGAGAVMQSKHFVSGTVRPYNPASGKFDAPAVPFEFTQSGYAIWNARIGYDINKHASLSLNINNVFDKTYYRTVGSSSDGNWYGEPRNVILTLRASY